MGSARSSALACAFALLSVPGLARTDVVIDRSAFGTTVEVSVADILLVRLPMDVANWQVDYSSDVLEMQTSSERVSSPGPEGWRLKAIAAGETDLNLIAIVPPGPAPPRFTVTIKVRSQGPGDDHVIVAEARISPDGRAVAYTRVRTSADGRALPLGVNRISFAGGESIELVSSNAVVSGLRWSHDGTRIGFVSGGIFQAVPAAGGGIDRTPSRSEFPDVTANAPLPVASIDGTSTLFAEAVGNGKLSLVMSNGRGTWIDLLDLLTGARVTVMRPGMANLVGTPSWNADATRFVVVGSTSEHAAEVFAGGLPLPPSAGRDYVGNVPPNVRRITFSNN